MRPLPLLALPLAALPVLLAACSASDYREDADRQVYGILGEAAEHVTGTPKTFDIDRPTDTLRTRLEQEPELEVVLDLPAALDVAAENSRDFQRQKELLYLAALDLTGEQHEFALRFSGGAGGDVSGVGDDTADASIRSDLFASRNTASGGRIVASFVNSFLKDLLTGGSFNGASVLGLTLTQPLLRGAGERIAREPLTQAERDVVYAMRTFERFRATFSVRVVAEYYGLLEQIQNLESEEKNVESTRLNRERVEALVEASRRPPVDLDRVRTDELSAQDRYNNAQASLNAALDRIKLTLGLPTDARLQLDLDELENLRRLEIEPIEMTPAEAIDLALARRLDYRVRVDDVEDAGRRVMVAENALESSLDFSAALSVPSEAGQPLDIDWSQVGWSIGFDLDLALDRLPERNAYRSALINMAATIRARELAEDQVKAEVRDALRQLQRTYTSYQIQSAALEVAESREERARLLLEAGRSDTLALVDATRALLAARLDLAGAIVDYAVARLELLRDLEGLVLEPKGLRYDPGLPLPSHPLPDATAKGEAGTPPEPIPSGNPPGEESL